MVTAVAAPPSDDRDRLRALLWWLMQERIDSLPTLVSENPYAPPIQRTIYQQGHKRAMNDIRKAVGGR